MRHGGKASAVVIAFAVLGACSKYGSGEEEPPSTGPDAATDALVYL